MLQRCLYSAVMIMNQGGQGMPNDSVDRIDTSLPGLPGPLHSVLDKKAAPVAISLQSQLLHPECRALDSERQLRKA